LRNYDYRKRSRSGPGKEFASLNPAKFKRQISKLQDKFIKLASAKAKK
jgi:hypothetical protein